MKIQARFKMYRDQALFRDLGFLLLAAGFFLVKIFDQPVQTAALYAPLVVLGSFGVLVGGAHLVLGVFSLIDAVGNRLGMGRTRR